MLDRLTANLKFHGEALALRAERQQVLASNIANVDTPNYQARDFDFGQALRQATTGQATIAQTTAGRVVTASASASTASGAAPAWLPLKTSGAAAAASPQLAWRTPEQPSIDGNTVDLDRERASFADNSLRYEATLRFINGNVRNLLSAIRGD
ncbi:MAG: flagellar basal body rod protein FlgB [Burkholderiaceae bacterium]|nr:flagellar basal body rod protein FlgB [Burkholderiaceae bacterium]MEB2350378.1 flagellar basal body rod protein FlgB [Burkholderiaceae bacterium]